MAPKRPLPSKSSNEPKKKRKRMTVNEKVNLLDMLKAGHSHASVARHYGLNESTVRYIKKDEVNIRKTASISFSKDTKRVVTSRNKRIVKMENALSVWILDCQENKVSLNTNMIRTKAKALYESLVPEGKLNEDDEGDDDENEPQPSTSASSDPTPREKRGFVASKGWFEKFKRRFGLHSIPLYGEASSADQEAALRYVDKEFRKIIDEGFYLPEQVFNMDETGLFRKRMPSRTFLYKDELKRPGFKARLVATEGFSDMTAEEVNTLVECHSNPLTDEELVKMTRSTSEEEKEVADDGDDNKAEERGLTLENLQELYSIAQTLQQRAQEIDDNMVRAVEFSNRIDGVMAMYKGIFAQKKKQRLQLPITMFLVRRKRSEEAPSAASMPLPQLYPKLPATIQRP